MEESIYLDKRVEEAVVIGLSHAKWVEAVAAVVPRKGETLEEKEIINLCKQHLAPFKVPKKVVIVQALHLNRHRARSEAVRRSHDRCRCHRPFQPHG